MYIFISYQVLFLIAFLSGLATAIIIHFIFKKPKNAKPIPDKYDGTNGYGYQPRPSSNRAPPKPS